MSKPLSYYGKWCWMMQFFHSRLTTAFSFLHHFRQLNHSFFFISASHSRAGSTKDKRPLEMMINKNLKLRLLFSIVLMWRISNYLMKSVIFFIFEVSRYLSTAYCWLLQARKSHIYDVPWLVGKLRKDWPQYASELYQPNRKWL